MKDKGNAKYRKGVCEGLCVYCMGNRTKVLPLSETFANDFPKQG